MSGNGNYYAVLAGLKDDEGDDEDQHPGDQKPQTDPTGPTGPTAALQANEPLPTQACSAPTIDLSGTRLSEENTLLMRLAESGDILNLDKLLQRGTIVLTPSRSAELILIAVSNKRLAMVEWMWGRVASSLDSSHRSASIYTAMRTWWWDSNETRVLMRTMCTSSGDTILDLEIVLSIYRNRHSFGRVSVVKALPLLTELLRACARSQTTDESFVYSFGSTFLWPGVNADLDLPDEAESEARRHLFRHLLSTFARNIHLYLPSCGRFGQVRSIRSGRIFKHCPFDDCKCAASIYIADVGMRI